VMSGTGNGKYLVSSKLPKVNDTVVGLHRDSVLLSTPWPKVSEEEGVGKVVTRRGPGESENKPR
jgi:hypothetical protein